MVTTLVSRKASREGLAALYTSEGDWALVFDHIPTEDEIGGQEPFLVIMSAGTEQEMGGESMNPATYTFVLTSMIKMDDTDVGGSSGAATSEDKLDELDQVFRQVVRDNPTAGAFADALEFPGGVSQTDTITLYDVLYRTEMWTLLVHHYSGS